MSTRCNVHFTDPGNDVRLADYNVYIHHDGYPDGIGRELFEFLRDTDGASVDAGMTCALWIVWKAIRTSKELAEYARHETLLDNVTSELCIEDHGDIEYRYLVDCGDDASKWPEITCREKYYDKNNEPQWRSYSLAAIATEVAAGS